jgi:hypothetical protein
MREGSHCSEAAYLLCVVTNRKALLLSYSHDAIYEFVGFYARLCTFMHGTW